MRRCWATTASQSLSGRARSGTTCTAIWTASVLLLLAGGTVLWVLAACSWAVASRISRRVLGGRAMVLLDTRYVTLQAAALLSPLPPSNFCILTFNQVVLANGTLANVSSTSHPDLYRALKGGGNNFCVVTRYDLATFPQGNMSVSTISYDVSQAGAVFDAFTDIAASPNFDPYVSLQTGLLYGSAAKAWSLSSSAFYTKPVLHPEVYRELEAVPSISNTSKITAVAALAAENPTPPL